MKKNKCLRGSMDVAKHLVRYAKEAVDRNPVVMTTGQPMAEEMQKQTVLIEKTPNDHLAMTDALAKLLFANIADEEFKPQLGTERANYLALLKRLH